MPNEKFSITKRVQSFKHALNGLKILFTEEHNARVHFSLGICAILAGFFFKISSSEWIAVIFSIGFVIALEIVNSAVENISDFISPEKHNHIKKIKDLAAASVLVGAITALLIGFNIFLPKIWALINNP